MTIGVEQNGFLGRFPECIHLPWPTVDKDLLINEQKIKLECSHPSNMP
jgi:hypothetical protein